MGGKIGPVRRRTLGRRGPAQRFLVPESRDPEEPLSAMINDTRRAEERRLQAEREAEDAVENGEE